LKEDDKLTFDIFRKPTATDIIIPADSCHPTEQKLTAIRYFMNRIQTYNLDHEKKQKETDTLKQIVHSNKYSVTILSGINNKKQKQEQIGRNPKWAKLLTSGEKRGSLLNFSKILTSRQLIPPTTT
jgi:hypothetical protein